MYKFFLAVLFFFVLSAAQNKICAADLEQDLDSVQNLLEKQLNEEQQAKKKASSVRGEINGIRKSLVSAAKKIQTAEGKVSSLEKRYNELKQDEEVLLKSIKEKQVSVSKLLAVLQTMSMRPSQALILQESDPVNALRSAFLLRDTIPLINRETEKLKEKLSALAKLRESIRQQYLQIKQASGKLLTQQQQITVLLNKKLKLQKSLETKAKQSGNKAKQLAAKAKDLQELIFEIEQRKVKDAYAFVGDDFDFSGMKGRLPLPVKGKIAKKYGETLQSGIISKGISVSARQNAQVIAPFDGVVVFSGPFRDYRDVLIIDHGSGYHTLLAGMEQNDTEEGQGLLAGEPVGTLPSNDSTLYVEIRNKGNAVNPAGWFIN